MFNRNIRGLAFSIEIKRAVWEKGITVIGYDPNEIRKDRCGAWIKFADYGNTKSTFGWEIDHHIPKSRGGTDDISNLQPLQWENNRHKADNYPIWHCKIKSN